MYKIREFTINKSINTIIKIWMKLKEFPKNNKNTMLLLMDGRNWCSKIIRNEFVNALTQDVPRTQ